MRTYAFLLLSLCGACGFGDDDRTGADVDGRTPDGQRGDAAVDAAVDAPPTATVFEALLDPATAIPDNTPGGVDIPFTVAGIVATTGLDVQVDVTHPYRGDIRIELFRNGINLATLKPISGSDAVPNIKATYMVAPAALGTPLNGAYAVRFTDTLTNDAGSVSLVRLTFQID